MITIVKYTVAAMVVTLGLAGMVSQPANAASCSNNSITQVSSAIRTLTWQRKDIGSGKTLGTGSSKTKTSVYYADCGDNNSKILPLYIKMCLQQLDTSNDPYFSGLRPTLTVWDSFDLTFTNDYLYNLTSDILTTTVGTCTNYNNLNQQYNSNGSVFWYAMSRAPSWSYYLYPEKSSDHGVVVNYSVPEKYIDPVNDPYAPLY